MKDSLRLERGGGFPLLFTIIYPMNFFAAFLVLAVAFMPALAYTGEGCREGVPVGEISFNGLTRTKPHVVERELALKPGVAYSDSLFTADARRLESLDLFSDIRLSCLQNGETQNVAFTFAEIFPFIPAPAGKKTDQDGWMLGGALAYLNFFGEDIRAEFQYRTSVDPFFDNNEYAIYASSPWLFGLPVGWNVELLRTDSYDELRNFAEKSWLADVDLEWDFAKPYALLVSGAYRYMEGYGHIPEGGIGLALDTRDSPLDARRGMYEEVMVTRVGAHKMAEDYVEYMADMRGYYTVDRFISGASALFRYRPGRVEFFDRYHHGGANTFRGAESDTSRHGESEMLLNFEERFVLLERRAASIAGVNFFYGLQLVAGLDGSFLWDDKTPNWDNFSGAIYGGVHLLIPALDRLRIEVGYAPDTKEPKLYVGLYEKNVSQRWRSR